MKATQYFQPLPTQTSATAPPDEGGLQLGQILPALRRRAWLIVGITIATALAAGLKALSDTPTYLARFEILVQPMSAESEVVSSLPDSLQAQTRQTQLSTEDLIKILTSSKVLLPVAKEFRGQYAAPCQGLTDEQCYNTIRGNLSVGIASRDSNILQVSYQGLDPQEVQTVLSLASKAYLDYSLKSRQVDVQRGIQFVETKLPDLTQRVETLQRDLQSLRQRYNLIDPASRGQELSGQVSAFKQEFLKSQVDLEQQRSVYSNLQSEIAQTPAELAASSALTQSPRYQNLLGQLMQLDRKIAENSAIFLDNTPDMQALQDERRNVLTLLERESQQVQREVGSQLSELEVRDQALQNTLGSLNGEVNELAVVSRIYTDLQRELQIATETLNQFLAKREALQIDAAQREIPWELLTPTTRPQPFASNVPRNLVLGAALGLLLGAGAALTLNQLTNVIYTIEELKRITKAPLLGTIPNADETVKPAASSNLVPVLQPVGAKRSGSAYRNGNHYGNRNGNRKNNGNGNYRPQYELDPFSESFRSLYANIRLISNTDTPIRSCVISSTVPGEGKSTVSIYLAQAAAAMGQRVLLVDTDLRYPRLHEYLGLANRGGLIDVIAGDMELADAIQRSPMEHNLYILTAGATPPDPTRVISSPRMQNFMRKIQNNFDLVIYDTPPLVGFADSYLLSAHTSGLLLIAQLGRVRRSQLDQTLEQLRVSNIPLLGVVLQNHA